MAKRGRHSTINRENIAQFGAGELIPLKGVWFRVAKVETGVLVLAMEGFTGRGEAILDELRAEAIKEYGNNDTNETISTPDGDGVGSDNFSGTQAEAGEQHDFAAPPNLS